MRSAAVILALAAVVACSYAQIGGEGGQGGWGWGGWSHPQYKFSYAVADKHTGDQKNAQEVRDGDVTKGSYSLVQPDGVVRTVKYIVTKHGGFQAQVINSGWAAHPATKGWGWGSGLGGGLGGGARSVIGHGHGW